MRREGGVLLVLALLCGFMVREFVFLRQLPQVGKFEIVSTK